MSIEEFLERILKTSNFTYESCFVEALKLRSLHHFRALCVDIFGEEINFDSGGSTARVMTGTFDITLNVTGSGTDVSNRLQELYHMLKAQQEVVSKRDVI